MQRIVASPSQPSSPELDVARERGREAARFEALADGARVARLLPDDGRSSRLEPADRVVEALPDEPLQALVAAGALAAELVPVAMPPDHAGRQQHRAADPRSLLADGDRAPELAQARGGDEPGHARARDVH